MLKTFAYTCATILTLLSLWSIPTRSAANTTCSEARPSATDPLRIEAAPKSAEASPSAVTPPDSTKADAKNFRGVQYAKVTVNDKKVPLLSGYGIYTDLCGLAMAQFASWGQYEAGAHLGIYGRYYPAVEIGIGQSNHTDSRSHLHYNVHSPYFRIGLDYNLNKNRTSRNRYFLGARYGFSAFSYDLDGPTLTDPTWGTQVPFTAHSVSANAHWGEIIFGIQSQIWRFIHLGWTMRYRARLHEKMGAPGHAYYIPGYGKGGQSSGTFGGTFNLVFEL